MIAPAAAKARMGWVAFVAVALLAAAPAAANVMDTYGFGARASAMGKAFTGLADDTGAVFYNPAGLTQITDNSLSLGYFYADPILDLDLRAAPGATAKGRDRLRRLARNQSRIHDIRGVYVGAALKVRSWLAVGLGVYSPQDWVVRLKPLSSRRPTFAMIENDAQRISVYFAAAVTPMEGLSFGAGFTVFADVDGRISIPMELNNANTSLDPNTPADEAVDSEPEFTIEFPIFIRPHGGVHWQATEWLSIGAAYHSEFIWDIRMEADAALVVDRYTLDLGQLAELAPDLFPLDAVVSVDIPNLGHLDVPIELSGLEGEVQVSASLPVAGALVVSDFWRPQQLTVGAAFTPVPALTITVDGQWQDWSSMPTPDLKLEIDDIRINLQTLPATLRGRVSALTLPVLGTIGPLPAVDISVPQIDLELVVPVHLDEATSPRTHDTWVGRLGVEYRLGPFPEVRFLGRIKAALRAGYSFEPSPFSRPNGFSNLIAMDRHIGTAGAGVTLFRIVTLDLYGQIHYLVPLTASRKLIDPDYPYDKLRASGLILAGGVMAKILW